MLSAAFLAALTLPGPPARYEFVPDTHREYAFWQDESYVVGQLDADGDFHETSRITGPGHVGVAYTGPGRHHLGEYQTYPRDVYEFRSGMLIPGRMVRARKFVPDEGGRVTRFADYRFDPRARPVWNLPGYFATGAAAGPWTRTRSAYNLPHAHDPR